MRTFARKPAGNKQVTTPAWVHPQRRAETLAIQDGVAGDRASGFDLSRVPVKTPTLACWLPQTYGTPAEAAPVLSASPIADRREANAVTLGRTVHLSSAFPRLRPAEQQRVLAHESVHVAQNLAPGPPASAETLETEAHRLGSQVVAGHRVQPQFHADPATALADDGGPLPNDRIAVRKAQARREVLLRWKAVYEGSQERDLRPERQKIRDRRIALDDNMQMNLDRSKEILGKAPSVEDYRNEEQKNIATLNKKPVTLEVTETAIRLKVRFHVRFEGATDKQAKERFPTLQQNLQKGIRDTWNQKLEGILLPGRDFKVIPEITLVPQDAVRNDDFWLITVRPTDKGPMVYENTKLGDPPEGRPTAVTKTGIGGGIVSIPPSVVREADTLGHETLHLFGLADRYVILPELGEFSLRTLRGRQDPLGAEVETGRPTGKILEEDLGFVLDQFGIYPEIPYNHVLTELESVEKIIKTGRDPDSMINKRSNFNDKIIKQAEDLD